MSLVLESKPSPFFRLRMRFYTKAWLRFMRWKSLIIEGGVGGHRPRPLIHKVVTRIYAYKLPVRQPPGKTPLVKQTD